VADIYRFNISIQHEEIFMSITKFVEQLSELIAVEKEEALKTSIKYEGDEVKEIIILRDNETKLRITVGEV